MHDLAAVEMHRGEEAVVRKYVARGRLATGDIADHSLAI